MTAPKFSICLITRNEEKTLPRLIESLKEFQSRGGEVVILDTGSTDNTVEVARAAGCIVTEAGDMYRRGLDGRMANHINKKFIVDGEEPVVKPGDQYFDFAAARNHAASLATNDMVSFADADEVFKVLDIDTLNGLIDQGFEQFEYNFTFAHDAWGNETVKFMQSKMYDRRKARWEGLVHEMLQGNTKKVFLQEFTFKLSHYQNQETGRHTYLKGLAVDCFMHLDKDRNSHYFARELFWCGRPKSAIQEFKRHVKMNGWPAEKAQSYIFMAKAWGMLNEPEKQVRCLNKAIFIDSGRREAFIELARFYQHNNVPQAAAAYAAAALEIPWTNFYANQLSHYTNDPHEILYWAKGWMGDIEGAKTHLLKALEYQSTNAQYLFDTKYYFEYPDAGIDGWMTFPELQFLYNTAKDMGLVAEIGSWKGRSTHALLSAGAKVEAIDTWKGSEDPKDGTHGLDVSAEFMQNVGKFPNLIVNRNTSLAAAAGFADKDFDMVFIDAGHTYEEVKADIAAWKNKARMILCGHDYSDKWPGVVQAVNEAFGKPDFVAGTIWVKYLVPKISIVLPTLGRPEGLKKCLASIEKLHYPKNLVETLVIEDVPRKGVPLRMSEGFARATGKWIVYAANDMEFDPECIIRAMQYREGEAKLIAFNTGPLLPDNGNICEHFMIKKSFVEERLGGMIFDTDFNHVGVDNLLWQQASELNAAVRAENAIVHHNHFSKTGQAPDEVAQLAWNSEAVAKDRDLLNKKTGTKIPKLIYSIWLNDENKFPEVVAKSIESVNNMAMKNGFLHTIILLDSKEVEICKKQSLYFCQCLAKKNWVKAADYLRIWLLYTTGGIYLDADMEIKKPFDDGLLRDELFVCREENGFLSNAVIGVKPYHSLLSDYLQLAEKQDGLDEKVFEYGMELWTKVLMPTDGDKFYPRPGVVIYPPEYFIPYNHQTGQTNITDKTYTYHHFLKSWVKEKK